MPGIAQFTSGVSLVEVFVTVTTDAGEPVSGLAADDFVVEEDGRPQKVSVFSSERLPLALAVGVDRSFSMPRDRLSGALGAVRRLVEGLEPQDEVMLLAIGSEVEVVSPLSRDRLAGVGALSRLDPWGTTPLYDAVLAAIDAIQAATGRRALILISDGNDRYSTALAADVIARARQSDVLVYPIVLGRTRPPVFVELATVSGGRSIAAADDRSLTAALSGIARELRSQYLLGYVPAEPDAVPGVNRTNVSKEEWRSIRVAVKRPNVTVRARDGYFAR